MGLELTLMLSDVEVERLSEVASFRGVDAARLVEAAVRELLRRYDGPMEWIMGFDNAD